MLTTAARWRRSWSSSRRIGSDHGSLCYTRWDREPQPVVDLRFDITPGLAGWTARRFLVFGPTDVERFLGQLSVADEGSWLEVRKYRGEIKRFTPERVPRTRW